MIIPRRLVKMGWRPAHLVAVVILPLLGFIMTFGQWQSIWRISTTRIEAGHVLLVPMIMVWLAWVRRSRIQLCRPVGGWLGILIILGGVFVHILGRVQSQDILLHLSAVLITAGCLVTATGRDIFVKFLPAFVVMIFLVPLPLKWCHTISYPVELATAELASVIYSSVGIHASLDGEILRINHVALPVSEACEGLSMVFALFLVSYGFVFGLPLRGSARVIILLLTPFSAVFCNVIGLIAIFWLYSYINPEHVNVLYQLCDWVMLPVAFMLLLGIIKLLIWASIPVRQFTLAYEY